MREQLFQVFCRVTVSKGRAIITALLLVQFISSVNSADASSSESINEYWMKDEFRQPPNQFRPWGWYHMMGGNTSKEGIRSDLKAMQRVGIGGFTIFDMAQDPKGPVEFDSPVYWELMRFAFSGETTRCISTDFR